MTSPARAVNHGVLRLSQFGTKPVWTACVTVIFVLTVVSAASLVYLVAEVITTREAFGVLFERMSSDSRLGTAIFNTLVVTVGSLTLQLVLGVLLALVIGPLPKTAKLALLLPSVLPAWTAALSFYLLLSPGIGLMSQLHSVGANTAAFLFTDQAGVWSSIMLIDSWQWLPFSFLVLSTQLEGLHPSHVAQAQLEGASSSVTLFRVVLPQLRSAIAALIILRVFDLLRIFDIPAMLFGIGSTNPKAETISMYLYRLMFQPGNRPYAAFVSLVICVLLAAVLGVLWQQLRRVFFVQRHV
jgi:ABC-type sugar transport system permease subunit